jgi:ribosomal protein L20A (L18A)
MRAKPILPKRFHSNKTANNIAKNSIKKTTNSKVFARIANKNRVKNRKINIENTQETYPIAMLNEAVLNNVEPENFATNIANNETFTPQSILVKVEEENSGAEGMKLYYLELNIKNGKPEIKPLAYINKQQINKAKKFAEKKNKLKKKPAAL